MAHTELALVAGAGPGLGEALLKNFSANGMKAVGLTRSGNGPTGLDVRACDLTDKDASSQIVGDLIEQYGAPKIVIHNTSQLVIAPFLETSLDEIESCWRNMSYSLAVLAQCSIQPMVRAGGGAFIVSGATASIRGGSKFAAFASAKFALRGMTQALAREFQPAGVHVAHTILDGIIDSERSRELHSLDPSKMISATDLAQAYWQLAQQPSSVWTHELDLRPRSEGF